jgi:putative ABC transport system substrate-binding protein
LHIELRFSGDSDVDARRYAAELINFAPDVIVTRGGVATRVVQQMTRTIPIVTAEAGDLIASGLIKDMAHPDGNMTGVTNRFASINAKLLQLLKEAAPSVRRIAVLRPGLTSPASLYGPSGRQETPFVSEVDQATRVLALQAVYIPYRNGVDIVRGIDAFAAEGAGGLMSNPAGMLTSANRQVMLQLASQYRLPTVSQFKELAPEGWLISYGNDLAEQGRHTATYVDRLLRGAKVSDLPFEFPTKFELIINLKTARALGLTIPITVLALADDVIE